MMNMQIFFTIAYTIIYIGYFILYRILLIGKFTKEVWVVMSFLVNTIGFFFYLIIYYPRKFPEHFNIFYDDIKIDDTDRIKMNSYVVKISTSDCNIKSNTSRSYENFITSGKFNKNEVRKNYAFPIIVINPLFFKNEDFNLENYSTDLMDKMCIGIKSHDKNNIQQD
jgi:hypothetical protein